MIDLATVAVIAKIASDGVGALDKVFRTYLDVLHKKEPQASAPPPDLTYVNKPEAGAFVAQSIHSGGTVQTVTYAQLQQKLDPGDQAYIAALTRSIQNYEKQWNAAYEQRSLASGMDIGRLDAQLDYLARQMADPLLRILSFVEKMGLHLDDHYMVTRNITEIYLKTP